jgi:tRNA (guanine37-N1)-methyltransferase
MRFDIITILPEVLRPYAEASILGRAQKDERITITAHDLRTYTHDKHHTVDDTPYGGGVGMVLQVAPIHEAVQDIVQKDTKSRVILLSAKGERFTQQHAQRLTQYEQLVFICGRFEGVDERVAEHIADEEISIGDFVLTGGELAAMTIVDSVSRLVPGVLGNADSIVHESHTQPGYKEYPQYTTPASYNDWDVPEVLLSGNHAAIEKWRQEQSRR